MEQASSRVHEDSAERAGYGLQAVLQQQKSARAKCMCAGAAYKHFSLILRCGVFSFLSPRAARRGAARGSAIQGLGKGGALFLVLIVQATAEEVSRAYIKPRQTPCRALFLSYASAVTFEALLRRRLRCPARTGTSPCARKIAHCALDGATLLWKCALATRRPDVALGKGRWKGTVGMPYSARSKTITSKNRTDSMLFVLGVIGGLEENGHWELRHN